MKKLIILTILLLIIGCSTKNHKNVSVKEIEDYSFATELKYIKKSMQYEKSGDYENALKYTLMANEIAKKVDGVVPITYTRISKFYRHLGNDKKANEYAWKARNLKGEGRDIQDKLYRAIGK